MSNDFINNFEKYKKLKYNGYNAGKLFESLDAVIFFGPLVLSFILLLIFRQPVFIISFIFSLFFIFIVPLFLLSIGSEGFFVSKYDELYKIKKIINKKIFKGSLFDIFERNCEITKNILKENKKVLENQLYYRKGFSGETILNLWDKIHIEKVKNEEVSTMIECNTKTGKVFKEIQDL